MKRRTSIYRLTVPSHLQTEMLLQEAIRLVDADPTVERAGAWTKDGNVVVLYRAAGDEAAIAAAEPLGGNTPGATLHIGLGVHTRLVATA